MNLGGLHRNETKLLKCDAASQDWPWFMEYAWWCSDSVCRTCPHLPRFLWRWGPPGLFPSGRTAAAPLQRRRSPGRAPHTRAAPTSACGSCSWERRGGGNRFKKMMGELGGRGVKMCYKLAKMMHEIESGDCAASLLTHTHADIYRNTEGWTARPIQLCVSPTPLPSGAASISHLLPDNLVLRRCWQGFSSTVSGRQGQNPNYMPGQETEPPRILHCRSVG